MKQKSLWTSIYEARKLCIFREEAPHPPCGATWTAGFTAALFTASTVSAPDRDLAWRVLYVFWNSQIEGDYLPTSLSCLLCKILENDLLKKLISENIDFKTFLQHTKYTEHFIEKLQIVQSFCRISTILKQCLTNVKMHRNLTYYD